MVKKYDKLERKLLFMMCMHIREHEKKQYIRDTSLDYVWEVLLSQFSSRPRRSYRFCSYHFIICRKKKQDNRQDDEDKTLCKP